MTDTKLILSDDIVFRNFHYFRTKFALIRKSMALLLDLPPFYIRLMEENRWFDNAIEVSSVLRMAEIFGVDSDDLLRVDFCAQQPADT